ncbi:uncharacterized protein EI97DRAFT_432072 [Westerdykella ornata]|uniref:Saccharopine dehydrogenase NADP binding domain-containing protein n=1 Tax=Westerdykella ornata TaxID=318751 RepID=A0A6A6JN06_WESOR|nr:uncharacterized protein EI97DRAFT_432072 [Westerdykella ornata]KAF2277981.1 hypothetical protein EI97DRAFT_432072 [Westerdykella ornata]
MGQQDSRQYELVLLGATGYTGKLTAEWISGHLPTDLRWAIAGRDSKKLQAVVDDLAKQNPDRKPPSIETVELEKDQLESLASKTRLIITTIGPFMFYGEPVLAACAEKGTHYIDSTGEVPWHLDMIRTYTSLATRNHALIIPQCGLDSVPADILTYAITRHIRRTFNAPTLSVTMSLYDMKAGLSGGTASTVMRMFSKYSLKKLAQAMKPLSMSPIPPPALSKEPPAGNGNLFYRMLGLHSIPALGGVQTVQPLGAVDTALVHRSWGLYEARAKETANPEISYGPNFRFTEHMRAKNVLVGFAIKLAVGLFGVLMAFPVSRALLTRLLDRFVLPAPGEGPSAEKRKGDFFSYRAVGVADTPERQQVLASLDAPYGGYAMTAVTMTAAADVILRGKVGETEAGRMGGEFVTSAMLGEEFLERLGEWGIKVEVRDV